MPKAIPLTDDNSDTPPVLPDFACARCRREQPITPKAPPLWVHDLAGKVHTGDIILFSSKHRASNITKFFTQSVWDHVGMVVKPSGNRAYIVEWGGGLFACNLVERLVEYAEWDGRAISLRQLKLGAERSRQEDAMEAFLDMLFRERLGQNRAIPLGQVTRAARRQLLRWRSTNAVQDDLTTLFCSKAIAVTYKAVGILDASRPAADFLPKHFSSGHEGFLDLQRDAALGPEIQITFEGPELHRAIQTFMILPQIFAAREVEAATKLQRAARRLKARRELRRRQQSVQRVATRLYDVLTAAGATAPPASAKDRRELLRSLASSAPPPRAEEFSSYFERGDGAVSVDLGGERAMLL